MKAAAIPTAPDNRLDPAWRLDPADDPVRWRALFASATRPALEQDWAFGEAMAATEKVPVERLIVSRDDTPVALVQAFRRKLIGRLSLIRPVFSRPFAVTGGQGGGRSCPVSPSCLLARTPMA